MENLDLESIANQLSCPEGKAGIEMGNKMSALNQIITNQAIQKLSPQEDESIVEIGPGNGSLSLPILSGLGINGHYLGIEMSEVMASELREKLRDSQCAAEVICGDCLEVRLKDGSVDGVIGVNILYFIDDLLSFFSHISNWLSPGGRAIFGIRSDKSLKKIPFTQFKFHIRSTEEIKSLMKNAGFDTVESYYFDEEQIPFENTTVSADSVIIVGKKSIYTA
ncbi:class I SAM-dependent methyltransferase [Microbulbifer sp. ANSA003]|uniref:class I SAM-dependent methyltransferase n=1 Tax=Microbulbifer sp. ANSA003 TaxID=3243360 RepID=UPI00404340C5